VARSAFLVAGLFDALSRYAAARFFF